jgi:CHAT domain-containing protein/tetratricopeptide (TPR) repeat protein
MGWKSGFFLCVISLSIVLSQRNLFATTSLNEVSGHEQQITIGDIHTYSLPMNEGEFVSILISESRQDITVSLFTPENIPLIEINLSEGAPGFERLLFVSPAAAEYLLQIQPSASKIYDPQIVTLKIQEQCSYLITNEIQRPAEPNDILRATALAQIISANVMHLEPSENQLYESIIRFMNAAQLSKESGDLYLEGKSFWKLAETYHFLSQSSESIDYASQALQIFRTLGDQKGIAETLNTMGVGYEYIGEYKKALDLYQQSLELRQEIGDIRGEAEALHNIGVYYYRTGDLSKALEYYDRIIPLWEEIADWKALGNTLSAMGLAYSSLSENQKAISYYSEALPLQRMGGDTRSEASTLNNIAMLLVDLGDLQKALDYLKRAEEIRRDSGDRRGKGGVLNNLGLVYHELGDLDKALDYYTRSLQLRREAQDKGGEAATLNNLGKSYEDKGSLEQALEYYLQALEITRTAGMKSGEAHVLNNLGNVYQKQKDYENAFDHYNEALELTRKIEDRQGEAEALDSLGTNLLSYSELQKAARMYGLGLQLRRQIGDRPGEAESLFHIAQLKRTQGQQVSALDYIDSCISIVESLRVRVLSQNLRASFFAAARKYYEFYQTILFELHQTEPSFGYDQRAFHVSERSRARGLMELLAESSLDLTRGVEPGLLLEERMVRQELNAHLDRQMRLISSGDWPEEAAQLGEQIETLNRQYEQIEARIRRTSPHYAEIMKPVPLTLKRVQESVLDDQTLLLEFSLGDEKSFVWAVSHNSVKSAELPPRAKIEELAVSFYEKLSAGSSEFPQTRALPVSRTNNNAESIAFELSKILLGPVEDRLNYRRLVIVADGPLQFVPFGALPHPESNLFLSAEHEVINTPSASTLAVLRKEVIQREEPPKTLAIFADPVFESEDERLKESVMQSNNGFSRASLKMEDVPLTRLPFTRREANAILSLVPADKSLEALDFRASRETMLNPDIQNYRYIHLATHGFVNTVLPEQSGIVLSLFNKEGETKEGFVSAGDIFNLKLRADVVVLSACRTALGKQVRGEGILGLARAFLYAGAARVVASLWKVDDVATAEFMQIFYEGMLGKAQLSAPEALRSAQIKMMNDPRWKSPYYWAGFVLQGDY